MIEGHYCVNVSAFNSYGIAFYLQFLTLTEKCMYSFSGYHVVTIIRVYIPTPILPQWSQVGNGSHDLSLHEYKGNVINNLSPQATSLKSTQNT